MRASISLLAAVAALLPSSPASAATFVVDDTSDADDARHRDGICATAAGTCTLRAALVEAELTPGDDEIHFDIPGPGPHRIQPLDRYAGQTTGGVVVDGTTQPGYDGTPLIWIDGSLAASEFPLFWFERNPEAVVRGLSLTAHEAVRSTLNDVTIEDCYVGIEPDGTTVSGASATAIFLRSVTRARVRDNVIGGAGWFGVFVIDTEGYLPSDVVIADNLIGTDASGLAPAPSDNGIRVSSAHDVLVTNNVISASVHANVFLGGSGVTVTGNLIGTDVTGTRVLGTSTDGIVFINAPGNRIGGPDPGDGNVIAGATRWGIGVTAAGSTFNEIRGNSIGTDRSGTLDLGNGEGIVIGASDNLVVDNVVANSGAQGIEVVGPDTRRVTLSRNLLRDDGALGIDLEPDLITPNDPGDADVGANGLQNYPVLDTAEGGTSLELTGMLDSSADTDFVVEVFASAGCDPSGHGEAERFVGSFPVTTDASGLAHFTASMSAVSAGEVLSATATGPEGTSELSACIEVTAPPVVDTDGDGVVDPYDLCPDSVLPESVPTVRLGVNRFADVDGDGVFDTTAPPGGGRGPGRRYTIDDTAGCTCSQIIDARGLGRGHRRFGCSVGVMDEWVTDAAALAASEETSEAQGSAGAGCSTVVAPSADGLVPWTLISLGLLLAVRRRARLG